METKYIKKSHIGEFVGFNSGYDFGTITDHFVDTDGEIKYLIKTNDKREFLELAKNCYLTNILA